MIPKLHCANIAIDFAVNKAIQILKIAKICRYKDANIGFPIRSQKEEQKTCTAVLEIRTQFFIIRREDYLSACEHLML